MKTSWILAGLISIANISTASMLFLNDSPHAALKKMTRQPQIEIKWGDS
jgi:hypothetical protein